jgi:hypothetical protein
MNTFVKKNQEYRQGIYVDLLRPMWVNKYMGSITGSHFQFFSTQVQPSYLAIIALTDIMYFTL